MIRIRLFRSVVIALSTGFPSATKPHILHEGNKPFIYNLGKTLQYPMTAGRLYTGRHQMIGVLVSRKQVVSKATDVFNDNISVKLGMELHAPSGLSDDIGLMRVQGTGGEQSRTLGKL